MRAALGLLILCAWPRSVESSSWTLHSTDSECDDAGEDDEGCQATIDDCAAVCLGTSNCVNFLYGKTASKCDPCSEGCKCFTEGTSGEACSNVVSTSSYDLYTLAVFDGACSTATQCQGACPGCRG